MKDAPSASDRTEIPSVKKKRRSECRSLQLRKKGRNVRWGQATARRLSVESRRLRLTLTILETPGSCIVTP
jgi:hypothetical protein